MSRERTVEGAHVPSLSPILWWNEELWRIRACIENFIADDRLARKQYAPVDVVQTEKKGFGLRAREDIPA